MPSSTATNRRGQIEFGWVYPCHQAKDSADMGVLSSVEVPDIVGTNSTSTPTESVLLSPGNLFTLQKFLDINGS